MVNSLMNLLCVVLFVMSPTVIIVIGAALLTPAWFAISYFIPYWRTRRKLSNCFDGIEWLTYENALNFYRHSRRWRYRHTQHLKELWAACFMMALAASAMGVMLEIALFLNAEGSNLYFVPLISAVICLAWLYYLFLPELKRALRVAHMPIMFAKIAVFESDAGISVYK